MRRIFLCPFSFPPEPPSTSQYPADDTIHESTANPRRTFEECKLQELADSIQQHGLIQPLTVGPNAEGFEIVVGARRFRNPQLAELFSVPARIVVIDDAQALEWQPVENSQRVDVHPYEEAQSFQRLLDMTGYDVAASVGKSGKSSSHTYARLSLLQLSPPLRRRSPPSASPRVKQTCLPGFHRRCSHGL